MYKSQLEAPPESYETTAIFVENIFDTVKKAKAAKAAAAKSAEPSYDYSFGNLSPVKKKKPRKNAKKNAKTKKPTTPKKKLTLRKQRALKETPEKRKKASPAKSPRKYTKRVPKVPAAADIDDEEAAFILSSISQRSFDSFYSRLNSSETNKIHIPLDISTHLPTKTLGTRSDPVHNLAYYVMLDHNYWIVEPEVPQPVEIIKTEPSIVDVPVKCEPEVQIHFKIQHSDSTLSINNEPQQQIADECCETTSSSVSPVYDKEKEVNNNNNKFPVATDVVAPFEQKSIKKESTAVKKRWLRQAVTEMKSPQKKRKKDEEITEINSTNGFTTAYAKQEKVESILPVNVEALEEKPSRKKKIRDEMKTDLKPSTVAAVTDNAPSVDKAPLKVNTSPTAKSLLPPKKPIREITTNSPNEASVQTVIEAQNEANIEAPVKTPATDMIELSSIEGPDNTLIEPTKEPPVKMNSEDAKVGVVSVQHVKIEENNLNEGTSADLSNEKVPVFSEAKLIEIEAQREIPADKVNEEVTADIKTEDIAEESTLSLACSSAPALENEDEDDEKSWESVMDFHRLQLEQLKQKNKRFSGTESGASFLWSTERTRSPDQMAAQLNNNAKQISMNRLPRLHTRFSLFENSEYIDPRKALCTSLSFSLEAHQHSNNVGPAPFQRSTSDISLSDARKNRWSVGNSSDSAPYNSDTMLPFNSFYAESHQFNRDEPFLKTCYRSQNSSWLNSQAPPDTNEWEHQRSNSFSSTYSSIKDTMLNALSSEENLNLLQKISSTPSVLVAKTKTSSCDPRLNPTLVQEVRKEEISAPKKKVRYLENMLVLNTFNNHLSLQLSLDQYRKRVSLTSATSSPPAPEESHVQQSPAFDPSIVADALTG